MFIFFKVSLFNCLNLLLLLLVSELNYFGVVFLCVNIFVVYCRPTSGHSHITSLIQVRIFFPLVLFETFVLEYI